jgi:hypothetical protein
VVVVVLGCAGSVMCASEFLVILQIVVERKRNKNGANFTR